MPNEKRISSTIIPAQPGYSLVHIFKEGGKWEATTPASIIAWRVDFYDAPNDDCHSEVWPVTVDENFYHQPYRIIEPSGQVIWQGVATYDSLEAALADMPD